MQNHPWHVLLNKVFYSSICFCTSMFALVQKYFLVLKKMLCSNNLYDQLWNLICDKSLIYYWRRLQYRWRKPVWHWKMYYICYQDMNLFVLAGLILHLNIWQPITVNWFITKTSTVKSRLTKQGLIEGHSLHADCGDACPWVVPTVITPPWADTVI